jgi:hypothetical protein
MVFFFGGCLCVKLVGKRFLKCKTEGKICVHVKFLCVFLCFVYVILKEAALLVSLCQVNSKTKDSLILEILENPQLEAINKSMSHPTLLYFSPSLK